MSGQREKRTIAALLPYRRTESGFEFYLQRRSDDARVLAGKLGMFGGGLEEGETVMEALVRELREELEYVPSAARLYAVYEGPFDHVSVFIEEVGVEFETNVVVHEGEYGIFMSSEAVLTAHDVSKLVQLAVEQFLISTTNVQ